MSLTERIQNGVTYLVCPAMEEAGGAVHGFSTRLGGVSGGMWESLNLGLSLGDDPGHVRENFRRFLSAIGAGDCALAMANQVHGKTVRNITSADCKGDPYDKRGIEADALITAIPEAALLVFTADCIPVLLYDPVRRVIAAVHAGWRGTAAGIVSETVAAMTGWYGSRPGDILAAVGPGIGQCCFETHEDVPNAMTAAMAGASLPFIKLVESGKFVVDLKGINAKRLELAGLPPEHIAVSQECTCCQSGRFWSHRRQGTQRGSMAAAIRLL